MEKKHFVLKLKEMRETAREELTHIPRGDSSQNSFRQVYFCIRMSSLGKRNPSDLVTKRDVLRKSVQVMRVDEPGFEPKYDKKYFKNVESKAKLRSKHLKMTERFKKGVEKQ